MGYSKVLRELLPEVTLDAEDLLLLESFQIKYFPDRVPPREFAALLRANPHIQRFLISKYPPVKKFIDSVLKENKEISDNGLIKTYADELVWEIADLIVYNKHPEIYEGKVDFRWEIKDIIAVESLKGKTVADVGAATGVFAFMLAELAETVYAIEPVGSFRNYMREKLDRAKHNNVYVTEGFLDCLPLPDNSIDVLFTSNAIGWNLEGELIEIERVVKSGGQAIHLMRTREKDSENPLHDFLTSAEWKYEYSEISGSGGQKFKYSKTIH
jgi:ubiquinone/menaquinone biosynthesis C-methylase UbiE